MTETKQPEVYWTTPTDLVPNSKLPVLVYRNVLPADLSADSVTQVIEANHWMKGGVFGHYPAHHYHSNTHECYAAIRGNTKCVYGIGPLDDQSEGVEFDMQAGDIAVHAAGVAHRNMESSPDYQYVGLYPKGSPKYTNSFGKPSEDVFAKAEEAHGVPIPDHDPIHGLDGPLPTLWKKAAGG